MRKRIPQSVAFFSPDKKKVLKAENLYCIFSSCYSSLFLCDNWANYQTTEILFRLKAVTRSFQSSKRKNFLHCKKKKNVKVKMTHKKKCIAVSYHFFMSLFFCGWVKRLRGRGCLTTLWSDYYDSTFLPFLRSSASLRRKALPFSSPFFSISFTTSPLAPDLAAKRGFTQEYDWNKIIPGTGK